MGLGVRAGGKAWLLCWGELERQRPPEACEEQGSKQGSEGVTMCLLLKIFPDAI